MHKEKFDTCRHVEKVGQIAIYVHPTCRQATMIKDILVSSKNRCRKCPYWEGKYHAQK